MIAISLWEPWASLIRTGAKTWETRSWETKHRGRLLICAAKAGLPKHEILYHLCSWEFQGGLAPLAGKPLDFTGETWEGVNVQHLNFGMAVAIVELLDCKPTGKMTQDEIGTDRPFGNFSTGRYAWKLNLLRNDFTPFPVKGKQGFFGVDDTIVNNALIHNKESR